MVSRKDKEREDKDGQLEDICHLRRVLVFSQNMSFEGDIDQKVGRSHLDRGKEKSDKKELKDKEKGMIDRNHLNI